MPYYHADPQFKERWVAGFLRRVGGTIREVYEEQKDRDGLNQAELARLLNVDRASINRQLSGTENLTLRRIAEIGWALGYEPYLFMQDISQSAGNNNRPAQTQVQNIASVITLKPETARENKTTATFQTI